MQPKTDSPTFSSWAVVELFGHRTLAGEVGEAYMFGTTLMRIAIPGPQGEPPDVQYYGGSAIYSLSPCSEAHARLVADRLRPVTLTPRLIAGITDAPDPWNDGTDEGRADGFNDDPDGLDDDENGDDDPPSAEQPAPRDLSDRYKL